jgi:hypothetical protein
MGKALRWLALACLAQSGGFARADSAPAAERGFSLAVQLQHAAYHARAVPSAIVSAAAGFDPSGPLHLVVFLHGYNGCVPVLMGQGEMHCRPGDPATQGWDLGSYHAAAHTNTLFVVPQLALNQRDGRPGRFELQGEFRAFLEELLEGPLAGPLGRPHSLRDVASVDLLAHSAGYQTALAIMEHGALGGLLKSVVLFDALYGEGPRFADYIEAHAATGLRFVSIALPNGIPAHENVALLRRLRRTLGTEHVFTSDAEHLAEAIALHPIVIASGTPPHRLVPANHLAEVLRSLRAAAH